MNVAAEQSELLTHQKRAWAVSKLIWNASPWSEAEKSMAGEARMAFRAFAEALDDIAAVRDGKRRPAADVVDALVILSAPTIKLLDLIEVDTAYFWRCANKAGVF